MSAAQWTIDQMYSAINDIQSKAQAERQAMLDNRAALNHLELDLASIPGPPAPAPWNPLTEPRKRQATIESIYARGTKQVSDLITRFRSFLSSHGVTPSSGLGALPLVPIAIIAVALVAFAVVAWLHDANSVQNRALTSQRQALDALIAGSISSSDYQATITATESESRRAMPANDPFGLTGFTQALIPIGIILAVIMLGPPLLRALPRRRAAA